MVQHINVENKLHLVVERFAGLRQQMNVCSTSKKTSVLSFGQGTNVQNVQINLIW